MSCCLSCGRFIAPRGDRAREHDARERSPVEVVRGTLASTWVQAIDSALNRHGKSSITIGGNLFPSLTASIMAELYGFPSWGDLLAHQCGNDLDNRAIAGLMDTFALHACERIGAQGRWELPLGIVVRKDGTRYIVERRAA